MNPHIASFASTSAYQGKTNIEVEVTQIWLLWPALLDREHCCSMLANRVLLWPAFHHCLGEASWSFTSSFRAVLVTGGQWERLAPELPGELRSLWRLEKARAWTQVAFPQQQERGSRGGYWIMAQLWSNLGQSLGREHRLAVSSFVPSLLGHLSSHWGKTKCTFKELNSQVIYRTAWFHGWVQGLWLGFLHLKASSDSCRNVKSNSRYWSNALYKSSCSVTSLYILILINPFQKHIMFAWKEQGHSEKELIEKELLHKG